MVLRSLVGASVKRKEDPGLITGAGKYVGDISCLAWATWLSSAALTPMPRS